MNISHTHFQFKYYSLPVTPYPFWVQIRTQIIKVVEQIQLMVLTSSKKYLKLQSDISFLRHLLPTSKYTESTTDAVAGGSFKLTSFLFESIFWALLWNTWPMRDLHSSALEKEVQGLD